MLVRYGPAKLVPVLSDYVQIFNFCHFGIPKQARHNNFGALTPQKVQNNMALILDDHNTSKEIKRNRNFYDLGHEKRWRKENFSRYTHIDR